MARAGVDWRGFFQEQVEVGEFFGAERMVPIANAHFMGDLEVLGNAGLDYLAEMVEQDLRVSVPTTRNAQSVDFGYAELLGQSRELQWYNSTRLHSGLGYTTPHEEHQTWLNAQEAA